MRELGERKTELEQQAAELQQLRGDLGVKDAQVGEAVRNLEFAKSSLQTMEVCEKRIVSGIEALCEALGFEAVGEPSELAPAAVAQVKKDVRRSIHKALTVVLTHYPDLTVRAIAGGWPREIADDELEEVIADAEGKAELMTDGLLDLAIEELGLFRPLGEDAPADAPPADAPAGDPPA